MLRCELTRAELQETAQAFFPRVPADASPQSARRAGLSSLGLPYAQDPAVTRHLAAFLRKNASAKPTAILFNGGVFNDAQLAGSRGRVWSRAGPARRRSGSPRRASSSRSRWARPIRGWRVPAAASASAGAPPQLLRGRRIGGAGIPGFAPPLHALCIAPFGMEEGSAVELPELEVGAFVGETTSFRFFSSDQRREDPPGARVDYLAELAELSPIEATLPAESAPAGAVVPVACAPRSPRWARWRWSWSRARRRRAAGAWSSRSATAGESLSEASN